MTLQQKRQGKTAGDLLRKKTAIQMINLTTETKEHHWIAHQQHQQRTQLHHSQVDLLTANLYGDLPALK